ncbi:hypothetical protein [Streptomyces sp. NBC_00069]|uniref:hypothetical protein n=1 Tax=Streptomyces sp. NBC_00069 TaxID=2975639 RepID=UPI0032551E84|nr:hypothetical protein OG513_26340 [Streptomyces sp. NBC_00998]
MTLMDTVAAGCLAAAVVVAVAAVGLPGRRRGLLWAACGLSAAAGCTLLMDLIALLFGQGVDSRPGAVLHALGLAGAVALGAAAGRGRAAAPAAPGPPGRWIPYVGVLCFLPYIVMKLNWALGGTFAGIEGAQVLAASERNGASGLWLTLERWGLDPTALMAFAGILLLFCLIRPWGLRLPRWLPLTPALIGVGTLVPYGLLGLAYLVPAQLGAVPLPEGDFASRGEVLAVGWIGYAAFAGYGVALMAATRSYWRRTSPVTGGR